MKPTAATLRLLAEIESLPAEQIHEIATRWAREDNLPTAPMRLSPPAPEENYPTMRPPPPPPLSQG